MHKKHLATMEKGLTQVLEGLRGLASLEAQAPVIVEKMVEVKNDASRVTIEQIREVLAKQSGDGKTREIKTLLQKYNASKLSAVDPKDYAAFFSEVGAL